MTAKAFRLMALGAVCISVASLVGPAGAADAPGAFGVGVLRRDGAVIPFAAYDGKRWSSAWPAPALDLTVPISLSAVPGRWWGPTRPLESWEASTAAGRRGLRVTQPDWVDTFCVRQIALRTDYKSDQPTPPPATQPYPKDGLAVSPPQPVERIEIVSASADDARSIAKVLLPAFNQAERVVEDRYGHPIMRRAREGVEPAIEAIYAFGTTPRVYYVEATRPYRQIGRSADECEAFAFGTGWFVRDEKGVQPRGMAVDLLPCDRTGASYMLPLGVMRLAGRLFWIAQFSGWDHERFVVVEVKPRSIDVVVNVWGGGCS